MPQIYNYYIEITNKLSKISPSLQKISTPPPNHLLYIIHYIDIVNYNYITSPRLLNSPLYTLNSILSPPLSTLHSKL